MIFRALVGAILPIRFTGAVFLRRGLERIRSEEPPLPNAFYDEHVGHVIDICARDGHKGVELKLQVTTHLERDMIVFAALLDGERHPAFPDDGHHMQLLRKYRLIP